MRSAILGGLIVLSATGPAAAAVPRSIPPVAEIVVVKGDEQVQFIEDRRWRIAEITQSLATGDALQTGPYGALALLFRDATQIRVQRNTMLVVKGVRGQAGAGNTELRLERGAAWSRARSVPDGLRMETPAVTAAIRGTDWHLVVEDDGRTTLTVLDGEVRFFNAYGSELVRRGEIAFAEVGRAPTKRVLVNPNDRAQWELAITPEWALTLNVTGLAPAALKAAERSVSQQLALSRAPADLLAAAEIAYELENVAGARALLDEARSGGSLPPPEALRAAVLDGLVLARQYRFDEAEDVLDAALPQLAGRLALIAGLGRYAVRLGQRRYLDAEALLGELERAWANTVEVAVAGIQLASLRGDQNGAMALARQALARHPQDTRPAIWLAHVALIVDARPEMRAAFERALALDPEQYLAWQLKGTYHQQIDGDIRAAMAAFGRVLDIAPTYAPAWNSLARLRADLGDHEGALAAIRRAVALAPADALYQAGLATILIVYLERLDEGLAAVDASLARDGAETTAMRAAGMAALKRGQNAEAVEWLLRTTVANPGLGSATTELGVAYYQAEDFEAARQSIDNAIRLDPNDPVAPLVGSVMAIDQAEAGRAVRLGREALARALRYEGAYGENLAKSQSGIVNAGSAYALLGLDDWALYYGQLSFRPELAIGHLFLGARYASAAARQSETLQGLLLDPLAVSTRARYFDFVHRPFHDVSLGVTLGSNDGALADAQTGILQGLVRSVPVAYFVGFRREADAGPRTNTATGLERVDLGLGARLDDRNDLLLSLVGSRARAGVPGAGDDPDPDDHLRDDRIEGTVGFHHQLGVGNHLFGRFTVGYNRARFDNGQPLGAGISALSYSLVRAFGLSGARQLYAAGLRDGGILGPGLFAGSPIFPTVGSGLCPACPIIASDLPEHLDLKPVASIDSEEVFGLLQARHLLVAGAWRATYGAEWRQAHIEDRTRFTVPAGGGTGIGVLNPTPGIIVPFQFSGAVIQGRGADGDREAGQAYVDLEWTPIAPLRVEAGLFLRHLDDDAQPATTQLDPRAGIAWEPGRGHWLRAAVQQALTVPLEGTLSPVGTVGLLAGNVPTAPGGSVTSWQARWDGEWTPRFFTFLGAERQRLNNFFVPVPQSLAAFAANKAEVWVSEVGANAWLGERWGAFARHRWLWSENLSRGAHHGDLPFVPARTMDVGVTWVHPAQIRVSALVSYLGPRADGVTPGASLDGFWTTGLALNWQPDRKRWSFTLAINNLFDERYELARGIPGQGLTALFSAEYRFGLSR